MTNRLTVVRPVAFATFAALIILGACNDTSEPSSAPVPPIAGDGATIGSSAYPHEPSGFAMLSDRAFNKKVENGWRDRGDTRFSIISDAQAPQSPSSIGKALFPIGWKGGTGPIETWYPITKARRNLYVSLWVRFSSNWSGHPSGSNKILNFWIDNSNSVILKARGAGMAQLHVNFKLQNINSHPTSLDINANLSSPGTLQRGSWHRIEMVVRSNTGGQSNGSVEWWVDGQPSGRYTSINIVKAIQPNTWQQVNWNPVWGGAGAVLDRTQDMQIDHVYISGN